MVIWGPKKPLVFYSPFRDLLLKAFITAKTGLSNLRDLFFKAFITAKKGLSNLKDLFCKV
jgi:hypothetical protein